MSVTEADVMTLMGETQEATTGGRQADISAAIERQYAYEAGRRADFGTPGNLGPHALAMAVPFVTGSAFGAISAIRIGAPGMPTTRLWQQPDPQVNFPPRYPGGEPMPLPRTPPVTNFPVPYEPPGSGGMWAAGGIGAVLAGVIGALWTGWPNALDPELGPYDTRAPRGAPNDETPYEGPDFGPPSQQGPPSSAGDNPPLPQFPTPYGGDSISSPDPALGPVPDAVYGPPQGARQPAPTPAPAPRTLPPWVWPVIGGIGALQLGRSGRSRSSFTLPLAPVGASDPLTSSLTSSSLLPQTSSAIFLDAGNDGCNCGPKKSGKKRKCLARAQLSWRSGPKKGKAAGTRCYRYAT